MRSLGKPVQRETSMGEARKECATEKSNLSAQQGQIDRVLHQAGERIALEKTSRMNYEK